MLTRHQRLCARPGNIATIALDGKAIIVDVATGKCFTTERVGQLIWNMIQAEHSLEQTTSEVLERYEVSPEQAYRDIVHFAAELLRCNLISILANGKPPAHSSVPKKTKLSYQTPILTIYTDMRAF